MLAIEKNHDTDTEVFAYLFKLHSEKVSIHDYNYIVKEFLPLFFSKSHPKIAKRPSWIRSDQRPIYISECLTWIRKRTEKLQRRRWKQN